MSENRISQRVLDEENRRAGRVIPAWRFYLAFLVTALGWDMYGRQAANLPSWAFMVVTLVSAAVWVALLGRYKKRSVN